MSTFTITTYDSAITSVTLTVVPDATSQDTYRIYVASVTLNSSLSVTGCKYQLRVIQTIFGNGYSSVGAAATVSIPNPVTPGITFVSNNNSNDPNGGVYTYTVPLTTAGAGNWNPTGSYLIGTQTAWTGTNPSAKFVLQISTPTITPYTDVQESGVPIQYTFEITTSGSDRDRVVNTIFASYGDSHLINNAPTLYAVNNYNTIHITAMLTFPTTVAIGPDNYNAILDTNSYVTIGSDFTLYVPQNQNTDGTGSTDLVESYPSAVIPVFNLMDLGLNSTPQTATGTSASVNKNMERFTYIDLYAYFPLSSGNTFVIDSITKTAGPLPLSVSLGTYPSNLYQSFTYQGYTFTLQQVSGNNVWLRVANGSSTQTGQFVLSTINLKVVPTSVTISGTPYALL